MSYFEVLLSEIHKGKAISTKLFLGFFSKDCKPVFKKAVSLQPLGLF